MWRSCSHAYLGVIQWLDKSTEFVLIDFVAQEGCSLSTTDFHIPREIMTSATTSEAMPAWTVDSLLFTLILCQYGQDEHRLRTVLVTCGRTVGTGATLSSWGRESRLLCSNFQAPFLERLRGTRKLPFPSTGRACGRFRRGGSDCSQLVSLSACQPPCALWNVSATSELHYSKYS